MSDYSQGPGWWQASDGKWYPPEQAPAGQVAAPTMTSDPYAAGAGAAAPAWGGAAPMPVYGGAGYGSRPVGKVRAPIVVLLLSIVTLGIYGIYWDYAVFQEMKDYSNEGIGGVLALVIALVFSPILWFLFPAEIGNLYAREGQEKPVSGTTGLWVLLPIVGGFIWLWKCQGRMNDFWIAHGATK